MNNRIFPGINIGPNLRVRHISACSQISQALPQRSRVSFRHIMIQYIQACAAGNFS